MTSSNVLCFWEKDLPNVATSCKMALIAHRLAETDFIFLSDSLEYYHVDNNPFVLESNGIFRVIDSIYK